MRAFSHVPTVLVHISGNGEEVHLFSCLFQTHKYIVILTPYPENVHPNPHGYKHWDQVTEYCLRALDLTHAVAWEYHLRKNYRQVFCVRSVLEGFAARSHGCFLLRGGIWELRMTSSSGSSQDRLLMASLVPGRGQACLPVSWRKYIKPRHANFNLLLICIQFQQKRMADNSGPIQTMFWEAGINFNLKLKGLSVLMEGSGEHFMR